MRALWLVPPFPCVVEAEKAQLLAASQAVVGVAKDSMEALMKSKALSLGDQKILAAVRVLCFVVEAC